MKKFFLPFGGVSIIFSGYLLYLFEFKNYDIHDAVVEEVAKEEYVIKLDNKSNIILDQHGTLIQQVTNDDGTDKIETMKDGLPFSKTADFPVSSIDKDIQKHSEADKQPPINNAPIIGSENFTASKKMDEKMTVAKIRQKYDPAIADLEAQAHKNLEALIDLAVSEYLEMEAEDQKISYPYFYNKYSSAASDLEKRTDQMFSAILEIMEQDLKTHGLPTTVTDTMVKEYENKKSSIRRDIMKRTAGL